MQDGRSLAPCVSPGGSSGGSCFCDLVGGGGGSLAGAGVCAMSRSLISPASLEMRSDTLSGDRVAGR